MSESVANGGADEQWTPPRHHPNNRRYTHSLPLSLSHTQLPATDDEYEGQALHDAEPAVSLYLPSTHASQVPPLGPV